jgi:methylthioribulose-1-phosphate dehydratase
VRSALRVCSRFVFAPPDRSSPTEAAARAIEQVVALARWAGARGWVPATSGNISVRVGEGLAALTATGADKAALGHDDVLVVPLHATRAIEPRLSAEAPLHLSLYRAQADVGAVVHVHPTAAAWLSRRRARDGALAFEGWEIAKGLRGVTSHEARVELPVLPNDQDTERLALSVANRLASAPRPCFGYLVAGHGLTAWGRDVSEARRHVETYVELLALALEDERAFFGGNS